MSLPLSWSAPQAPELSEMAVNLINCNCSNIKTPVTLFFLCLLFCCFFLFVSYGLLQVLKKLKLTILASVLMAFMEERTLKVLPLLFLLMSALHFLCFFFAALLLLFSHSVMNNSLWLPWAAAWQSPLSFNISRSLPKLMSIESVVLRQ